jgi:hypothetical protein
VQVKQHDYYIRKVNNISYKIPLSKGAGLFGNYFIKILFFLKKGYIILVIVKSCYVIDGQYVNIYLIAMGSLPSGLHICVVTYS